MAAEKPVAYIPGQIELMLQLIIDAMPVYVDVTTASDSESDPAGITRVQHDLGRIPHGYAIIKQPPASTFTHGADSDTTAWDNTFLYIEFDTNSVELTLAIF